MMFCCCSLLGIAHRDLKLENILNPKDSVADLYLMMFCCCSLLGIAHRDLKPENILCACENQVERGRLVIQHSLVFLCK